MHHTLSISYVHIAKRILYLNLFTDTNIIHIPILPKGFWSFSMVFLPFWRAIIVILLTNRRLQYFIFKQMIIECMIGSDGLRIFCIPILLYCIREGIFICYRINKEQFLSFWCLLVPCILLYNRIELINFLWFKPIFGDLSRNGFSNRIFI